MSKKRISKEEREKLIDQCIDTRMRWYAEDNSIGAETEQMLRYGRVGYRSYSNAALVAEIEQMRIDEHGE